MSTDAVIRELAARQHGIVTRAQLLAAGLTRNQVDGRIGSGALEPVFRGVFRVGPVRASLWREMASILVSGAGAVLSHQDAVRLWELPDLADADVAVHVTTRGGQSARAGIRLHRRDLIRQEVTERQRIPVTTVPRTLLDISAVVPVRLCERVVAEALARGLVRERDLREQLARRPTARGAARLAGVLSAGPALTRSEAENRLLSLVREAQLPAPQVNARLSGFEVDFLWRRHRLVVEVDGYRYHASTIAFENDRRRDAILAAAGLRVIRVTWRQLQQEPLAVLGRVAQALAPLPARD